MGQIFGAPAFAPEGLWLEKVANFPDVVRFVGVYKLRLSWPPERKRPTGNRIPRSKPLVYYAARGRPELPRIQREPGEVWPEPWREILNEPARERAT